jgi:Na+/proline symporter
VALASLVLLPTAAFGEHKAAYPHLIGVVLPVGLRGLMVASLLAAFMSTVDTHLNWGASYLVCDIYKRFVRADGSERHYVWMARVASLVLAAGAVMVGLWITSIKAAWALLYSMGAGLGPVLILRWFWWRANAWTELSALAASVIGGASLALWGVDYEFRLAAVAGGSLTVALVVTFLTGPEPREKLEEFYQRVRPGGVWGPIAQKAPAGQALRTVLRGGVVFDLLAGIAMLYGVTLGIGKLLFAQWLQAGVLLAVASAAIGYFALGLRRG